MVGGYDSGLDQNPAAQGHVWDLPPNLIWQADMPISPRAYPAVAYDELRGHVVVVGGDSREADTGGSVFEYVTGTGWVALPPIPPNPVNNADSGRATAAMVYDSRRGVFVLMGGAGDGAEQQVPGDVTRGPGSRFSDTWEFAPERASISQGPADTGAKVCQSADFTVTAGGHGTMHYQWRLDGQGDYTAQVSCGCGATDSRPGFLSVGNANTVQLFSTGGDSTLLWSNPNGVLEQADSLLGPWRPVPGVSNALTISTAWPAKFFRLRSAGP
jgi:hypothetical protein